KPAQSRLAAKEQATLANKTKGASNAANGADDRGEEDVPAAPAKLLDQVIAAAKGQTGTAAAPSAPAGAGGSEELPPEPEAPEPIRGLTVKEALPPREEGKPGRVVATAKAREMRAAARKAP